MTKIEDMSEPQRQAWITLLADGAVFDAFEKDERDIEIERKGAHWGYRLMQWGVGGIIVMIFLHHMGGSDFVAPISIEKTAEIIFALLVVSYVADLVKQGIMIWAYRGDAADHYRN